MIEGIDSITYSTDGSAENWAVSKQFFLDWGLVLVTESSHQLVFETLNGAQVVLLAPHHPALAGTTAMEAGATLREVVWGVTDADFLQTLPVESLDPHGLRVKFQLSQKRAIALQGSPSNTWGDVRRVDRPTPVYERATPIEIGHVVLFTDCLVDAVAFYERLGFTVSDQYPNRGVFLRCAKTGGHHDLFLLQLPTKTKGVNHVAFTVRDIHEVFGGGLAMSRAGWKTQLGPGRHPISSAYFWYFECPVGGLIEYNADEDHLTEAWQAREFEPSPTRFAEWAIEGGIDGVTRRQPKAEAGGTFLTQKR
ncbi:MAG: VOC family protein [Cytophagales bacterium]|nr:VOC family protein [Cytophagales bacterium]